MYARVTEWDGVTAAEIDRDLSYARDERLIYGPTRPGLTGAFGLWPRAVRVRTRAGQGTSVDDQIFLSNGPRVEPGLEDLVCAARSSDGLPAHASHALPPKGLGKKPSSVR